MVFSYAVSLIGSSHVAENGVVQDYSATFSFGGITFLGVADGVGSSLHSEVASKKAIDVSLNLCKEKIKKNMSKEEKISLLKECFRKANDSIKEIAINKNEPISNYDTTLTISLFDGNNVFFGHCGDGGIIVLKTNGYYEILTKRQKGEDGVCVVPLRSGEETWIFGSSFEVASILLATDGIFDILNHYLLRFQKIDLYIPVVQYFMDNQSLRFTSRNYEAIKKKRIDFLSTESWNAVTDDKTIAVAVNSSIKVTRLDDSYYKEPNWVELQNEWNKKAYPSLFFEFEGDKK